MGLPIVCLGEINLDLLYQVQDLEPFLTGWPELHRGGAVALGPGEEARLQELLDRQATFLGRRGGLAANTASFEVEDAEAAAISRSLETPLRGVSLISQYL